MVPSILPDAAHERHSHRRDKLTHRQVAAGFVAVVFLITCTTVETPATTWPRASA